MCQLLMALHGIGQSGTLECAETYSVLEYGLHRLPVIASCGVASLHLLSSPPQGAKFQDRDIGIVLLDRVGIYLSPF